MWIVELLGGVRATVFAAISFAALAAFGVDHYRLQHAQTAAAVCAANERISEANIATLKESNASKDAAVTDLKNELDRLTGLKQEVESAREAALTALATAEKQRDKALADARTARRALYANDQASALWAAQPTSRGVTRELRDLWAAGGGDEGPRDREAGASVRTDPAGTAQGAGARPATAAGLSDCTDGCFSNDQVLGATTTCLTTLGQAQSQLRAIATLQAKAVAASTRPET